MENYWSLRKNARTGKSITEMKNSSKKLNRINFYFQYIFVANILISAASADNCSLGLQNSSYHAQLHPINDNNTVDIYSISLNFEIELR